LQTSTRLRQKRSNPLLHGDNPTRRVEIAALTVLALSFLAGIYLCETVSQQVDTRDQPSTLADSRPGAAALYTLLYKMGFHVERLSGPWSELNPGSGVLVVLEPLSRHPTEYEIAPLRKWIEQGGTLMFVCTGQPQQEDPRDSISGDVRLDPAQNGLSHPTPDHPNLPYCGGIKSLCVSSPLRMTPSPSSHYQVLFRDDQGIIAIHKPLGRGHVILMCDDLIATNRGIAQDDNAVFLVNVAAAGTTAAGPGLARVTFDEYHHGVGFESYTPGSISVLIQHMPRLLKWTLLDLFAFLLVIVYSGNLRRAPLSIAADLRRHPPRDYVRSMARLYRRAGSRDLVIRTLYDRLLRDLRHALKLAPESKPPKIISAFNETFDANNTGLKSIVVRCDQIVAGSTITELEMLALAETIDKLRRDFGIVGTQ